MLTHMAKYFVAGIAIVLVAGGAYYWWTTGDDTPPSVNMPPVVEQIATSTYATTTFSLVYPQNFSVDDSYAYEQFEGKPIHGVKFTIPLTMATGTNLSADTYLSVETLPRANSCSGDIYVVPNVRAEKLTENGVDYSLATTTEAAAGNRYEEMVYSLEGSKPCSAVRYFIHSLAIENFEPGAVREYDRSALLAAFDAIRQSLKLVPLTP